MVRKSTLSCYPSSSSRHNLDSNDVFQLLFLSPEDQTVEVWETNSIDCKDLASHLRAGGSVFISSRKQDRSSSGCWVDEAKEPAYLKRV